MKERPILFSAPMIRAILAGTKSQTRRIVKTVGNDGGFVIVEQDDGSLWPYRSDDGESMFVTVRERGKEYTSEIPMSCPYGAVGTHLWVREAWHSSPHFDCLYRADYEDRVVLPKVVAHGGWKPSIFMPRKLSRITLEITGVKVERLGELNESDARQEGVASVAEFIDLWKMINRSWEPQTWTWVLQFKKE